MYLDSWVEPGVHDGLMLLQQTKTMEHIGDAAPAWTHAMKIFQDQIISEYIPYVGPPKPLQLPTIGGQHTQHLIHLQILKYNF